MASFDFEPKSGRYHIRFRFANQPFKRSLRLADAREAQRVCGVIEESIKDVQRGRLAIPEGAEVGSFLISGGAVTRNPKATPAATPREADEQPATLGRILDLYFETLTPGSKETNSIYTETIHAKHLKRLLKADRRFDALSVDAIQRYVNERAKEGVVQDTIHKELGTLRVVWGWAFKRKHLASPAGWKMNELTLPKAKEKPPFQTWQQITRRSERGGLTPAQVDELWACLWLDQEQTLECLGWVRDHAVKRFTYPMFAMIAYTGARRSEMVRSERDDWDFDAGVLTIRQKKSDKSKSFTRRNVPIHSDLAEVMKAWFANHPGGPWTIATEDGSPIDPRFSSWCFRQAVDGGRWKVLHGFHTFRHSLASNLAAQGIDPRQINDMLGHSTGEMERRYRHLCPKQQATAIQGLFRASGANKFPET